MEEISLLVYKQRFKNPNDKSTASKNYAYIRYIATRPRVAKNEGMNHGLFGQLALNEPLREFSDWKDVAHLVYENSKKHVTMYCSVISFEENTAKELFLKEKKAWQRYLNKHIRTIAEKNEMKREYFQWAAAFHQEKKHPHLHVAFWDNSEEALKIKNPFTPPSVPNDIRKQMIKETFADRIRAYGAEKNKAVVDLRKVSDELVEDFERHMRQLGRYKYQKLREEYDRETEWIDAFNWNDDVLKNIADRVFRIKAVFPVKGRIAYQFLSVDLKKQVEELTTYLLSEIPNLQRLKSDYVESKMKMVFLYGGKEEYLLSQRRRFEQEADKIIANRILGMIKTLNRWEKEGKGEDYFGKHSLYPIEQMMMELFDVLFSLITVNNQQYERGEKRSVELSKEAKKELYLKYQDKGYEH